MLKWSVFLLTIISYFAVSADTDIKGLVDLRSHITSNEASANSYLSGDYGKFRFNDGNGVSLGQLGVQVKLDWDNPWSATVVANAFANNNDKAIGLTEAYVAYKGLPNDSGWRFNSKIGIFYPKISLENIATAWSTPYTLTSSSLNNWIGEELRSTGVALSFEKLGKFSRSPHSFEFDLSFFQGNDPAGAMLAWHGWTIGSRQTLLNETLVVQNFPARSGMLAVQAAESDPFLELDNRWGVHAAGKWHYKKNLTMNVGYYDNKAEEGIVRKGQYTWTTEFLHAGFNYRLSSKWRLIGQYMHGNTNMNSPFGDVVVNNDYENAFMLLQRSWTNHNLALRVERFEVEDLDTTWGDDNSEQGNAWSLAYRYKLNSNSFILSEFNLMNSERNARHYVNQPIDLIERQFQLAYRRYF